MTTYAALCAACGLSLREAADFNRVRLDTAKSWSSGRNGAPAGALQELAELRNLIEEAADQVVDRTLAMAPAPPVVELGLASDDHEARSLGWPCVGTHRVLLGCVASGLIVAGLDVVIVPRGSTPATAGAADAHKM